MSKRAFTIVELIITITIMGVLMILAVVSINATQVRARDDERKTDIEAIATALESYYNVGDDSASQYNRYSSTALASSESSIRSYLRDINMQSVMAPGEETISLVAATNSTQTTTGISPQPTYSQYVYQPINSAGSRCTSGECRKYNLYYRLETDNTVYKYTSKNQ